MVSPTATPSVPLPEVDVPLESAVDSNVTVNSVDVPAASSEDTQLFGRAGNQNDVLLYDLAVRSKP